MVSRASKNSSSKQQLDINSANNFKSIVVGDSGVGKSCFLSRYSKSTFNEKFKTTIGVDYDTCKVGMSDGTQVNLQVWDTAGQERFRAITNAFYRQAQGIFLVYDCCDMSSLENIKNIWFPDARRCGMKDAKIVLVGNKVDNIDVARQKGIDTEAIRAEARAFAEQQGIQLIETSAKQNSKIDDAFLTMARELQDQAASRAKEAQKAKQILHIDYPDRRRSVFAKLCGLLDKMGARRRRHRQRKM